MADMLPELQLCLGGIDPGPDRLVGMSNPTTGQLTSIGPLGVNTAPCAALDVTTTGTAYASLLVNGYNALYRLSTHAATLVGWIASASPIQGIAIAQ